MIEIKKALPEQLDRLIEIEQMTFPPEEAAVKETFAYRMEKYPYWFRSAKIGDEIVGYICGIPVEAGTDGGIRDGMYEADTYPSGDTFAFLAIGVDPAHQRKGIGELLVRTIIFLCKEAGMKRIILACKEEKLDWYGRFGFEEMGPSASEHGGAVWYDMELCL